MREFKISLKVLVPFSEMDFDDQEQFPEFKNNPDYVYQWDDEAKTRSEALDEFHWRVPIACLDDFEIECEEVGE